MKRYRKHIRLKGFDYSESLYYFVTVCTRDRQDLFIPFVDPKYGHQLPNGATPAISGMGGDGVAADSQSVKNEADQGSAATKLTRLVVGKLDQIPKYYPAEVDFIHFILAMLDPVAAESYSAHSKGASRMRGYKKTPLSQVIRSFKSWITREAGKQIFQPNYYEHIIRSEHNLDLIRNYLLRNPYSEYDEINWKKLDP